MKKIDGTKLRAGVLCILALLCGAVLAVLRIDLLFGPYDPSTGLYPDSPETSAFEIGMIALSLSLALGGLVFAFGKSYRVAGLSVPRTFSGAFLGFAFLSLGVFSFIRSKVEMLPLSRFEGVLIILSLVCAASFFTEAFSKSEGLGREASAVLMMFRPVGCLFISFFFYFDSTTVIHDSNKKMATLFFAAALLALLYETKLKLAKARIQVYASLYALSLCYGIMYAVPNLAWYFSQGESLILNVFFDIVVAALSIWSAVCLLSVRSDEPAQTEACVASDIDQAPADSENAETDAEPVEADGSSESPEYTDSETSTEQREPSENDDPEDISETRETQI